MSEIKHLFKLIVSMKILSFAGSISCGVIGQILRSDHLGQKPRRVIWTKGPDTEVSSFHFLGTSAPHHEPKPEGQKTL